MVSRRPNVVPFGEAALRIALPAGMDPAALLRALRSVPGVIDAVITERHACVHFDPRSPPVGLDGVLEAGLRGGPISKGRLHTIRARYDGADLPRIGELTGLSRAEIVALHSAPAYSVRFLGFLPGFAYLGDVDERLRVPRLPSPRSRVPANSIGIADARAGIYPFSSSGGWNLVATALDHEAFRSDGQATFAVGDEVRFEPVP